MSRVYNIAKNTSYLTVALIMQKVVSFTYFMLLARNLSPESLGKYYSAIAFTTIFSVFIDFGLMNVVTREVAKEEKKSQKYLGAVLAVKIPLALMSLLGVFALAHVLNYSPFDRSLVYISSIAMIFDSFTFTFYAVLRGYHNLARESIGSVMYQLLVLIIGLYFVYSGYNLLIVLTATAIGSFGNFIYSLVSLKIITKLKIRPLFHKDVIVWLVSVAVPFGAYAVFQRLYMYFDTILLKSIAGDQHVGYYQVAFKIIFALQFLPMAFVAALYPAMSKYWKTNTKQLAVSFERAINYLVIVSLPISVGIIALSEQIVSLLRPEYLEAVPVMRIMMASLIFIFVNFPVGSLLNACDRQKRNTFNMFAVLVFSVILNLVLIPRYQALGAGITVLATNFLMFFLGMIVVPTILRYNALCQLKIFAKAAIAAICMGVPVYFFQEKINIILNIGLGGLIYFVLLLSFKGFNKEDIMSIYESFKGRKI